MDCKRLEAELINRKSYTIQILWNKYFWERLNTKYYVEEKEKSVYNISEKQQRYEVCYCVRYRPLSLKEWILARWRWNDKWEWTPDGIFNDWIV